MSAKSEMEPVFTGREPVSKAGINDFKRRVTEMTLDKRFERKNYVVGETLEDFAYYGAIGVFALVDSSEGKGVKNYYLGITFGGDFGDGFEDKLAFILRAVKIKGGKSIQELYNYIYVYNFANEQEQNDLTYEERIKYDEVIGGHIFDLLSSPIQVHPSLRESIESMEIDRIKAPEILRIIPDNFERRPLLIASSNTLSRVFSLIEGLEQG
ncbi:MAG: hypothetical protein WEC80_02095 [Patescibacteria group bacterium]